MRERQIPFMGIDIEVYRALRPLLTTEQVGEVIDALIDYAQDDEYKPSFDDQAARAFFAILASKVENSITKYNEKCEKNRKNANKTKNKTINNDVSNTRSDGERPQAMASNGERPLPNVTNVTPSVTQKENLFLSVTQNARAYAADHPTPEKVREYARQCGKVVNAESFMQKWIRENPKDHNGNPADWRMLVLTEWL